jgi:hypothetical protein
MHNPELSSKRKIIDGRLALSTAAQAIKLGNEFRSIDKESTGMPGRGATRP